MLQLWSIKSTHVFENTNYPNFVQNKKLERVTFIPTQGATTTEKNHNGVQEKIYDYFSTKKV